MARQPARTPPRTPTKTRIAKLYGDEVIVPPKKKLVSQEAKELPKGSPAAGRIVSEESVAVRQGIRKGKAKG